MPPKPKFTFAPFREHPGPGRMCTAARPYDPQAEAPHRNHPDFDEITPSSPASTDRRCRWCGTTWNSRLRAFNQRLGA